MTKRMCWAMLLHGSGEENPSYILALHVTGDEKLCVNVTEMCVTALTCKDQKNVHWGAHKGRETRM